MSINLKRSVLVARKGDLQIAMHFTSTILSVALAISTTSAAAISERVPIIGGAIFAAKSPCPVTIGENTYHKEFYYGDACGHCVTLDPILGAPPKSITNLGINPKCRLTLFSNPTCAGDGAVSGPNCWSPEGGIAAYQLDCPWWDNPPPVGAPVPCRET